MRIDDALPPQKAKALEKLTERASTSGPAKRAGGADDRVQLSLLSQFLNGAQGPDRLEGLTVDVRSGSYNPDPLAVSRKIVSFYLGDGR